MVLFSLSQVHTFQVSIEVKLSIVIISLKKEEVPLDFIFRI